MDEPVKEGGKTEPESGPKKFGTFDGVFLPNILTILGVILYLRQGKVMGEAGLLYGILIILIAHVVTVTTGLSLSSVSTNMRVKAGGAYYIISRSLGIEWGGCIGIPLAVSQVLSIALYVIGFSEALRMMSQVESLHFMASVTNYPLWLLGSVTLAAMTALALKSSALVIKTQYFVFALVVASLVAIFAGTRLTSGAPQMTGSFEDLNFWQAFALFFPAVTGITAGVSLSGDLKDPRKSIPLGTLVSVVVGMAIYMGLGVFLCFYASDHQLRTNNAILLEIAWRPEFVLAGVWAATISSGLGMVLAAPRTIQALANDGVLPRFLGKSYGKGQEPVAALLLALVVAEGAILVQNLDLVAPVLSMFFLVTYGTLNLVAGLESLVDNPSYRPTLRTPWWVSLLGAGCCFYVMFLINTVATIAAFAVITIIYLLLKRQKLKSTWGDLRRGFWLSLIRRSLLQVERLPEHAKNWRPNIMVVTGIPQGRQNLVELADWLGSRRGLVTLHHVLVGPHSKLLRRKRMALNNLVRFIRENDLNVLPAVDVVEDRTSDLRIITASQGFGSFQPNTVMLDWNEREEVQPGEFEKLCHGALVAQRTLLILRVDRDRKFGNRQKVDVWIEHDSSHLPMLLLLAFLISQDEDWAGSHIGLHVMMDSKGDGESRQMVHQTVAESRIPVTVSFHDEIGVNDFYERTEVVARQSTEADLLIVTFPYEGSDPDEMQTVLDKMSARLSLLPSVLFVRGQEYIDLTG